MTEFTKIVYGQFSIYFAGKSVDPDSLIGRLNEASTIDGKGREGIKLIHMGDMNLACRKYVHGGLLRAITSDIFLTGRRALSEMTITRYIEDQSFPVVSPFCIMIENRFLTKRLHFLTIFEENSIDFLEYLQRSGKMTRLRAVRRLAELLYRLEILGIYHPDLHLNNVLITAERRMVLLDFDRSRMGKITKKDILRMFWRLNRFAEKMEKKGLITFSLMEKTLFLRTYRKLSGSDLETEMNKKARTKGWVNRFGWLVEQLLYGRDTKG